MSGKTKLASVRAELAYRYINGATTSELAAEYNVAASTIAKRLREAGVKLRKPGVRPDSRIAKRTPRQIYNEYCKAGSMQVVADRYGVTRERVRQIINKAGYKGVKKTELLPDEVVQEYRNGTSLRSLGKKYNVCAETVKRALIERGVQIRPFVIDLPIKELSGLYEHGYSLKTLASLCNVSPSTMAKKLKKAGVQIRGKGYYPSLALHKIQISKQPWYKKLKIWPLGGLKNGTNS